MRFAPKTCFKEELFFFILFIDLSWSLPSASGDAKFAEKVTPISAAASHREDPSGKLIEYAWKHVTPEPGAQNEANFKDSPKVDTEDTSSDWSIQSTTLVDDLLSSPGSSLDNHVNAKEKLDLSVPRNFTIGYLTGSDRLPDDQKYKRPGLLISGALTLAVDEINNNNSLVGGHRLTVKVAETYGQEQQSILQTARLWTANISVYVGPQETCVHEARMAASFGLPMISYFCTHPVPSDKSQFPTFARTRPPDTQISKSVAALLKRFHWKKVSFLFNASPDEGFGRVAVTIKQVLASHNISVVVEGEWHETYHHGYSDNPFKQLLLDTQHLCRIYLVLGHYYEFIGLMTHMQEKGLFENGEYFVVGVSLQQYKPEKPGLYLRDFLNENTTETTQRAYRHFIGVLPSAPLGMDMFAEKVNDYLEKEPFCYPNALGVMGGLKRIRAEAAYLYDAVYLYAWALNATLKAGGDPHDGQLIISEILGKTYKSAMGYMVHMDDSGDAEGNYTLVGRQADPQRPGEFGLYPVGVFLYSGEDLGLPKLHLTGTIDWRQGKPPIDEPPCGYQGAGCRSMGVEIAASVVGALLVLTLVVAYIVHKSWRYEQELDNVLWKIDYRDICAKEWAASHLVLKMAKSGLYSSARCSQISLGSAADSTASGNCRSGSGMQVATYKGRVVAVKTVSTRHVDITRSLKKELKRMRDLHHDNVAEFVGACVDAPHVCIVTEYCTRGSLKDILSNPDVKLDAMFNASLIGDIVNGMIYLHESPVRCHGNLKTSNCLVDSRWVVKITDFGLYTLRSQAPFCVASDYSTLTQQESAVLLYRAPELLREGFTASLEGTVKGDVYAFAIILYEVHSRQWAWGGTGLTATETLLSVMDQNRPGGPYRPGMGGMEGCLECVRAVLKECWAESPDERPDFRTVRTRLRPMRKGMKANIFDNMLALMEQYAIDLEALVSDRTQQLDEEKKKTEALLFKMLPRSVAEQLRRGNTVEAEHYDSVTIYFSDIVGFTQLSASSTALESGEAAFAFRAGFILNALQMTTELNKWDFMENESDYAVEIVDFLNDLYTCFDAIVGNFDVYKVETIGDAYMVVSGAPLRNGLRHASEVASMSLALLDAIKKFKIRHRPKDVLMLRIGLHSGPVCAGVVGQKMPRYCLFGDTVNTASRMESSGLPLRIHCSEPVRNILTDVKGFCLEKRGSIPIKGKGTMTTYWLVGKTTEPLWVIKQRRHPEGADGADGLPGKKLTSVDSSMSFLEVKTDPAELKASRNVASEDSKATHDSAKSDSDGDELVLRPQDEQKPREMPGDISLEKSSIEIAQPENILQKPPSSAEKFPEAGDVLISVVAENPSTNCAAKSSAFGSLVKNSADEAETLKKSKNDDDQIDHRPVMKGLREVFKFSRAKRNSCPCIELVGRDPMSRLGFSPRKCEKNLFNFYCDSLGKENLVSKKIREFTENSPAKSFSKLDESVHRNYVEIPADAAVDGGTKSKVLKYPFLDDKILQNKATKFDLSSVNEWMFGVSESTSLLPPSFSRGGRSKLVRSNSDSETLV